MYRFIARYPIAAVDTKGLLTLNSCNFIVPTFKNISATYLAAVLNSSAVRFYFEKKFHTIKVLRSLLEEVPIPIASEDSQREVEFLVEQLTDDKGLRARKSTIVMDNVDYMPTITNGNENINTNNENLVPIPFRQSNTREMN